MTMINTPAGIAYVRLASLKGALKLESLGMKTRGGSLRPRLAKEFGLKPRAPYADYIAYCLRGMELAMAPVSEVAQ